MTCGLDVDPMNPGSRQDQAHEIEAARSSRVNTRDLRELEGDGFKRYFRLECLGLRNRTPSPVAFSSMNSMPFASSAARIFLTVSPRPPNSPSANSSRATVGSEIPECRAKSDWDHPTSARAALTCRIVVNLEIRIDRISIDTTTRSI